MQAFFLYFRYMLNLDDYYFLGKVTKPHGLNGLVNVWLDVDNPANYNELEMVFIDMDNNLIPYFIKSIKILNNKAIVDFQDVENEEGAILLSQKDLYLPIELLPKRTGNAFYFHEIKDFELIDELRGRIGKIKIVLDYPNQALFQVFTNEGKEVLIPINDDIVKKVDRKKKQITVLSPEGLLDIYLDD